MAKKVVRVTTEEEKEDAFKIREKVFMEEQDVPEELEWDGYDDESIHFVAYDGEKPVGAARIRQYGETGKTARVERVSVVESRREEGWGRLIMEKIEEVALNEGFELLTLSSQTHAQGFYEKMGYRTVSDVFEEEGTGIPHVKMVKEIDV
ncbi:MAG: GNAT family N-acetyltransferase [Halobacteria archaeon]|nr:GNAT family N-acetyltransferase [Halobacteria archaeon]